ncbi:MAG: hypothetical protein L0Y50_05965, partial [Beijerinckiaceae bacterium]|nr:hypothetical protein [Beijerinckiaceae bacterium]
PHPFRPESGVKLGQDAGKQLFYFWVAHLKIDVVRPAARTNRTMLCTKMSGAEDTTRRQVSKMT